MATSEAKHERLDMWRKTARGVGVVALIFSLVVGVLLVTDWLRAGQAKTVRSDALGQMLLQARQTPDSGTVAQAREMDLVARHAYFSSVTFRSTGTWMLTFGLLVMVACCHVAARLGRKIEDPRRFPAQDLARADRDARLAMLVAGVLCLLLLPVWGLRVAATASPVAASNTVAQAGSTNAAPAAPAASAQVAPAVPMAPVVKAVAAFQWNCFRGPRCGVAPGSNAPTVWNGKAGTGVLWQTPLAKAGVGSPVAGSGKIYLTSADEQVREVVAYDAATGRQLWRQEVADGGKAAGEALPQTSADTGLAAPTAACDDAGVYAIFGTGDLVAYAPDGKLLWQVYLGRPDNTYGHASSLLVDGGRLYVQYDQPEKGRVLAVDAAHGKTIWEKKRTQGAVWCSPVLVPGGDGRPVLLVNGQGALSAYEPDSGKELWSVDGVTGDVAPSAAWWNGRVFIAMASARMICYELAGKPVQKWEYAETLPDVASPVAADGLVYLATSAGQLACLDAADGKEVWKHDGPNGFYASPVICGSRVYALDREGVMHVLAAGRTFEELAASPLGDATDATPAFADGRIYVRTKSTLWCLGAK